MKNKIPLPEPVKVKAQSYLANIKLNQQIFSSYIQGYVDSLDLKNMYALDTDSWSLIRQSKEEK